LQHQGKKAETLYTQALHVDGGFHLSVLMVIGYKLLTSVTLFKHQRLCFCTFNPRIPVDKEWLKMR